MSLSQESFVINGESRDACTKYTASVEYTASVGVTIKPECVESHPELLHSRIKERRGHS